MNIILLIFVINLVNLTIYVQNPLYLISGRPQNVENYTLSIDRSNIDIPVDTACRMGGQNYTCSYSRTSNSSTDVSVAAVNIIGSGPSRTCSANRNISKY